MNLFFMSQLNLLIAFYSVPMKQFYFYILFFQTVQFVYIVIIYKNYNVWLYKKLSWFSLKKAEKSFSIKIVSNIIYSIRPSTS